MRETLLPIPKSTMTKALTVLIALLLLAVPAFGADLPTRSIRSDASLRSELRDAWFLEVPARVMGRQGVLRSLPGGGRVEVRIEQGRDEFLVVLARERNGTFPGWSQGSWVLYRSKTDGRPIKIRSFLRTDPYTYVQFRPLSADRSQMDVVVYGGYLVRSLVLPYSFEQLYLLPVEEVLETAGRRFPRRYFDIESADYADVRSFVAALRSSLGGLSYRDDGALDEAGRPVFIATLQPQDGVPGLNCSGFAKWVVDGILKPLTGSALAVAPLKLPLAGRGSSFSEPYEALRDPYFGLDWTRNLGLSAAKAFRSGTVGLEEVEVRSSPVGAYIRRSGTASQALPYAGYLKDAGFGVEGLQALLYTLAVDHPSSIYLASINAERGSAPRLRQHFHVAVLVPHFSEDGAFVPLVFESAQESSFDAFLRRYPGHHVNLIRIPVEGSFLP